MMSNNNLFFFVSTFIDFYWHQHVKGTEILCISIVSVKSCTALIMAIKLNKVALKPSFFKKLFQWSSQTVTEHRTASTDRRCEYLNGYVTVQHRSFGKPSFLDPRSSILETETWSLHLETGSSHLKTRSVRASRREDRVSSFEHRVSTYFWAVL